MVLISNSNVDIESESKATTNLDNDYDSNNATPKDSAILNGGTIKYRQVIEAEVKHYEYIYYTLSLPEETVIEIYLHSYYYEEDDYYLELYLGTTRILRQDVVEQSTLVWRRLNAGNYQIRVGKTSGSGRYFRLLVNEDIWGSGFQHFGHRLPMKSDETFVSIHGCKLGEPWNETGYILVFGENDFNTKFIVSTGSTEDFYFNNGINYMVELAPGNYFAAVQRGDRTGLGNINIGVAKLFPMNTTVHVQASRYWSNCYPLDFYGYVNLTANKEYIIQVSDIHGYAGFDILCYQKNLLYPLVGARYGLKEVHLTESQTPGLVKLVAPITGTYFFRLRNNSTYIKDVLFSIAELSPFPHNQDNVFLAKTDDSTRARHVYHFPFNAFSLPFNDHAQKMNISIQNIQNEVKFTRYGYNLSKIDEKVVTGENTSYTFAIDWEVEYLTVKMSSNYTISLKYADFVPISFEAVDYIPKMKIAQSSDNEIVFVINNLEDAFYFGEIVLESADLSFGDTGTIKFSLKPFGEHRAKIYIRSETLGSKTLNVKIKIDGLIIISESLEFKISMSQDNRVSLLSLGVGFITAFTSLSLTLIEKRSEKPESKAKKILKYISIIAAIGFFIYGIITLDWEAIFGVIDAF